MADLPLAGSPATETARRAIVETVVAACGATLADALEVQARHSAAFMVSPTCREGVVGGDYAKTMLGSVRPDRAGSAG